MGKIIRLPLTGTSLAIAQDRHGSATRSKFMTSQGQYESQLFATVRDKNGREREIHEYLGNRVEGNGIKARAINAAIKAWYGKLYKRNTTLNLGSGLTTNLAALATANEAVTLASPSGARINLLFLANNHATGTGSTAAAATDIKLQTADAVTPQAGAQTLISVGNTQKLQTVATLSGYGTEAVTEWGLFTSATLSASTGSPFTAGAATTGTVTATPLTASSSTVQGQQQTIFHNTGNATPSWGLVISNTTSVVTVPAWYKVSDGTTGANPANTDTYVIRPVMYDHKVFSAINTVTGDTIQFTYQLTIASGN